MAVTAQDVKDVAPELASQSDPRIDKFIAFAENSVNRSFFKDNADLAVTVMAAHLLTVSGANGQASVGNITQKKVGEMSISYGSDSSSKTSDDGLLGTTSYGRWFLQLRRQYPVTPFLV